MWQDRVFANVSEMEGSGEKCQRSQKMQLHTK